MTRIWYGLRTTHLEFFLRDNFYICNKMQYCHAVLLKQKPIFKDLGLLDIQFSLFFSFSIKLKLNLQYEIGHQIPMVPFLKKEIGAITVMKVWY